MRAKFFDVILLGENLAGLIAATLLAARKYTVLWIRNVSGPGQEQVVGNASRRNRLFVPDIFDLPIPKAVLRELNLGHTIRSNFKGISPLFQYVIPGHRASLPNDRVKLAVELEREFGDDANPHEIGDLLISLDKLNAQLDAFLAPGLPVHPAGIKQRWEYSARLKELTHNLDQAGIQPRLEEQWSRNLLARIMTSLGGFTCDLSDGHNPMLLQRASLSFFQNLVYPTGDQSLEELLIESLDKHNGRILQQTALQEVENRQSSTYLHDVKNTYGAESLIFAMDSFLLPNVLPGKKNRKFAEEQLQRIQPSHTLIKLSLVLDRKVIPEGMEHVLFQLDAQHGDPLLFSRDPEVPMDSDIERLDVYQSVRIEDFVPERVQKQQQKTIERIKALIPFLEGNIKKIYFEQVPKLQELNDLTRLAGRRLLYSCNNQQDFFGGIPYTLPMKNSYLAGAEVLPELGLEGDFITGWSIAREISKKKPKKDELKKP